MRTVADAAHLGRNNNFDFLRFVAATGVVYSHSYPLATGHEGDVIARLTDSQWTVGDIAVGVFFIISGFLITQSWLRLKSLRRYVWARFLRIVPALAVVVVLSVVVLGPLVTTLTTADYFTSAQTWTYLLNVVPVGTQYALPGVFGANPEGSGVNGSLWTITPEIWCYAAVAGIALIGLLRRRWAVAAGYCAYVAVYVFCGMTGRLGPILVSFGALVLYFGAGMLLCLFADTVPLSGWVGGAMLVCGCGLDVVLHSGLMYPVVFTLFGAYPLLVIAFSRRVDLHNFSKWGDFSYGMYIYAFPIQQLIVWYSIGYGQIVSPMVLAGVSLVATLVCAAVSWHLVEAPCLRYKQSWLGRKMAA